MDSTGIHYGRDAPVYRSFRDAQESMTPWDGEFVKDMDVPFLRDLNWAAYLLGDDSLFALSGNTIINWMEGKSRAEVMHSFGRLDGREEDKIWKEKEMELYMIEHFFRTHGM